MKLYMLYQEEVFRETLLLGIYQNQQNADNAKTDFEYDKDESSYVRYRVDEVDTAD